MPNNFYYALASIFGETRDPALNEIMSTQSKKTYRKKAVIEVPSTEIFETTSPRQRYLTQHPVKHPLKPEKFVEY